MHYLRKEVGLLLDWVGNGLKWVGSRSSVPDLVPFAMIFVII
jgi:hypothetical protein